MKLIVKGLFLIHLIYQLVTSEALPYEALLLVLLIIALDVIRERFWASVYLVAAQLVVVTAAVYLELPFGFLYALIAFSFAYSGAYAGVAATAAAIFAFSLWHQLPLLLLLTGASSILGHIFRQNEEQTGAYSKALDQERHLRYSLEKVRKRLLSSQQETAHLAEIKERNRIAREIHDGIGHSIAGVLIQLQVAERQIGSDDQKARQTVELCTGALAEALSSVRETVYNLKPKESLGIEYVERIIADYGFCPIDFTCAGDFESMPPEHMETAAAVIREALTNTARYSKATGTVINLETNEKFTRIMIKDNGVGCGTVREGMGISGMKERVRNLGGTLSINAENGFTIVCMLFKRQESGNSNHEMQEAFHPARRVDR